MHVQVHLPVPWSETKAAARWQLRAAANAETEAAELRAAANAAANAIVANSDHVAPLLPARQLCVDVS